MNKRFKKVIIISIVLILIGKVVGNQNVSKPGDCPPPTQVMICNNICTEDAECAGIGKCCPTMCGGNICTRPVTKTRKKDKSGSCPTNPSGPWVCTSTCVSDSDCRGRLKCCTNRCNAFACQPPELLNNNFV